MTASEITSARRDAEQARRRLTATLGDLQERLKPAALASNAWEGVKDKSGEIAEDAVQAVKERPIAVSAVLGAFTLFLARAPIRSAVASLLGSGSDQDPPQAEAAGHAIFHHSSSDADESARTQQKEIMI